MQGRSPIGLHGPAVRSETRPRRGDRRGTFLMGLWTQADEDRLKDLADGTLSATEIAARLGGVSRNAVIGKIMRGKGQFGRLAPRARAGERAAASRQRPSGEKSKRSPRALPGARDKAAGAVSAPAPAAAPAPSPCVPLPRAVAPVLRPMSFLEAVMRGRCLFFACDPYAPDGPDMPVCGHERAELHNTRYCRRHLAEQVDAARSRTRETAGAGAAA